MSALTVGFSDSGAPSVFLHGVAGGTPQIIFAPSGKPLIHLKDAGGEEVVVAP